MSREREKYARDFRARSRAWYRPRSIPCANVHLRRKATLVNGTSGESRAGDHYDSYAGSVAKLATTIAPLAPDDDHPDLRDAFDESAEWHGLTDAEYTSSLPREVRDSRYRGWNYASNRDWRHPLKREPWQQPAARAPSHRKP